MVKRALLVAYHFPPVSGSSGVQRTLSFSRDLAEFGWQPVVLSAHTRAYPATSDHQLRDVRGQAFELSQLRGKPLVVDDCQPRR